MAPPPARLRRGRHFSATIPRVLKLSAASRRRLPSWLPRPASLALLFGLLLGAPGPTTPGSARAQDPEPRQVEKDLDPAERAPGGQDPDSVGAAQRAARDAAGRADLMLFDAETLLHQGKFAEAIAALRDLTRLQPGRVEGWQALAQAYGLMIESSRPATADSLALLAVTAYRRILEIQPRHRLALNGVSLLGARFNAPPEQFLRTVEARRLWARSDSALARRDAPTAVDLLRRLARLQPNVPAVYRRLAQALTLNGAPMAEIRAACLDILRVNPADAVALTALGGMALEEGNEAEAERLLRVAFELAPDDSLAREALARLEEKPGGGGADTGERLFYRGRIEMARGNREEGIALLERATALDSTGVDYQKYLGIALFIERRYPEALERLRHALEQQGEDQDLPFYIGASFYYLGSYELAASYLGPAANAHRPRGEAARLMAMALARGGEQPEGVVYYLEQAVREGSGDPALPCLLGEMYVRLNRWEDARGSFADCARLNPDQPAALLGQGLVEDHDGHPRAAVNHLTRFLATQPASPAVHMRLGLALLKLARPDSALGHFRTVLNSDTTFASLKPDTLNEAQVLDIVFIILMSGRNNEDGIAVGERLIELEPGNGGFANNLAMAYADADRNLPRALTLAQKARAATPDDGGVLDTYGWVLARLGRHEEARRALLKAVDLTLGSAHPDASEIYFHLGFLLAAMHRQKEAVVWARKSLEQPTNPLVEEAARGLLERLGEPVMEAN